MFEDKIIIITGGLKGIGRGLTEYFARLGSTVYAFGRSLPEDHETFFSTAPFKDHVKFIEADVSNFDSVKIAVDTVIKDAGKIDVLVNNAGITKDNLTMRMSEADWDQVIDINLKGTFLMSKAVVRQMMSQRHGRIINIGSIVGTIGNAGQANYAASKAGLIGLTKSLAKEFSSRNVLVNLVAPGYVKTEMTEKLSDEQKQYFLDSIPLKRIAEPEDIAGAVAFFASDASKYITGQVIHVDGGLAM